MTPIVPLCLREDPDQVTKDSTLPKKITYIKMGDSNTHNFDSCILSNCSASIVADASGRILCASPAANALFKDWQENHQETDSSFSVQGKTLDVLFAEAVRLEAIQPAEIITSGNVTGWIYTCSHMIKQVDESVQQVIYLAQIQDLKEEYINLSRNPIPLDSITKMASTDVPDYISDSKFHTGEIVSMSLDKAGRIIHQFPFTDVFLNSPRSEIHNQVIMQFIHPNDHIILTRSLAECLKQGVCHFIARWSPLHSDPNQIHWLQGKALRCEGDQDKVITLTLSTLLENKNIENSSITSQTWDLISASMPSVASAAPAISSIFMSFFTSPPQSVETDAMVKLQKSKVRM